jgi:hypothetical protein
MMDKSAIFGALWAAWGAPTCGMGPPQPFPIAVIGKITQIFLETQSSRECQLKQKEFGHERPFVRRPELRQPAN